MPRDDQPAAARGTLAELRPKLREVLADLEPSNQDDVITLLRDELEVVERPVKSADIRPLERGLGEADAYYAIKFEDLDLLKEAGAVAAALALGLQNPVGLVAGLVVFLFRYRKKRFKLDGAQGLVLKTLRRAPTDGWTVDELAAHLPSGLDVKGDRLAEMLAGFKTARRADGKQDALVAEKDARWWVVDL